MGKNRLKKMRGVFLLLVVVNGQLSSFSSISSIGDFDDLASESVIRIIPRRPSTMPDMAETVDIEVELDDDNVHVASIGTKVPIHQAICLLQQSTTATRNIFLIQSTTLGQSRTRPRRASWTWRATSRITG